MKVTKEQVAENRAALVQATAKLIAERGIDGVGVAEISRAAGLTHGALYGQFASKDELVAEALAFAVDRGNGNLARLATEHGLSEGLTNQLDYYLSEKHRDNLVGGCAMAASASEAARQGTNVRNQFTAGFQQLVGVIEPELGKASASASDHERALLIAAAMVGAVAVARAAATENPRLSRELLKAARNVLGDLAGEAAPRRSTRAPRRKADKK